MDDGNVHFFDVRVFHPNAQSYHHSSIHSLYRKHEQIKKREYGNRVREVEYASFTPLVLATSGGMGREATMFYKRLADTLSTKNNAHYSTMLHGYVANYRFHSSDQQLCVFEEIDLLHITSQVPQSN